MAADVVKNRVSITKRNSTPSKRSTAVSIEAIEAEKRLKDLAVVELNEQKANVETLMADVKKFDDANAGKYAEVIAKYDDVAKQAAVLNMQDIHTAASARIDALGAQADERRTGQAARRRV